MRVDRDRFLWLAMSLAIGCGGGGVPAREIANQEADPDAACFNDVGTIDTICAGMSPACEGLGAECLDLDDDLRPRVAERWASCFANADAMDCLSPALGACMREAVESACPEPEAVATCERLMEACEQASTPARYSLETCAQVVAAVKPSADPDGWQLVDEQRLGPGPSADHCSLEHVLPYQPYGFMWRE